MMVAMSDCMILEHELGGDRGITVERCWSSAIELIVAQSADRGSRRGAVASEQFERSLSPDGRVLLRVPGIHCVDVVASYALDRLSGRDLLRQLDLDRIDGGDVVNDDADFAAIVRDWRFPFRGCKRAGEIGERRGPVLEAIGKRIGSVLHCRPLVLVDWQ